jgi:hypothetical protein
MNVTLAIKVMGTTSITPIVGPLMCPINILVVITTPMN